MGMDLQRNVKKKKETNFFFQKQTLIFFEPLDDGQKDPHLVKPKRPWGWFQRVTAKLLL